MSRRAESTMLPMRPINTLASHAGPINCIAFSHLGGTYILTGSSDRTIHLSRTEPSSTSTVTTVAPTPSPSSFPASSSWNPTLNLNSNPSSTTSILSSTTKTTTTTTARPRPAAPADVPAHKPTPAPSPSAPIQKYTSHGYAVLSLSISSTNTHFASTGGDRTVFYWDIQTPTTTVRRFGAGASSSANHAHTQRISTVSFAGVDDSVLVSGSDDRTIRLWDVKSRDTRPLMVLDDARDSVSAIIVPGSHAGQESGSGTGHGRGHDHGHGPGFRADVDIIAGSVDGRVRTYDIRMGRVVTDVQPGSVTSLDLTPDGKVLLVGCLDGKIRMMDRRDGKMLRAFPPSAADGHETASSDDGQPRQDASSGPTHATVTGGTSGYKNDSLKLQSCFGANGSLVLSGSEADGRVRAWDVISGRLVAEPVVSEKGKVVSVVKWRQGSTTQGRQDVWAAGGADGVVKIYGR